MVNMMEIINLFKKKLADAQSRRKELSKIVKNHREDEELEWVVYEREVMFNAVNDFRKQNGKEPIGLDQIFRVENLAVGHSDYSSKFSLYCSELAV